MLVLSRKNGETIMIGDDIEVKVLDRDYYGRVKLGISAPEGRTVHRLEVWLRIQAEKAAAARRLVPCAKDARP
jgi:carbon storage regulator